MNETQKMLIVAQNVGDMGHFSSGLFAKYAIAGLGDLAAAITLYVIGWGLISTYNYFAELSIKKEREKQREKERNGK